MISLIDFIVCFAAVIFATIFCSQQTIDSTMILQMIKVSFLYSTICLGLNYFLDINRKKVVNLKYITSHAGIFAFSSFVALPFLHMTWISLPVLVMTNLLSIMFWSILHCSLNTSISITKPKVIIIGNRALIESVMNHHAIQTVGAICFDDRSQCIGGYVPNLGNLDDLPMLLKRLQNIPNLSIVAEEYIANKIKSLVTCPILAINESSLELYETA